jgi:hypothetical protein
MKHKRRIPAHVLQGLRTNGTPWIYFVLNILRTLAARFCTHLPLNYHFFNMLRTLWQNTGVGGMLRLKFSG